ncbi:hypothetical protein M2271_007998 [Streptomyces sp. LBL]|uniref:hypothetical protein n=1 Tax=Streptomyces sp. LBL TaxID=2940562 RepID=UPI002474DDB5|nr:hypothetical protein [Streptomyces sp. LBL]MDH6630147.1 hypothetical protein [Streptomyces sp. LBL]
MIISSSDRTATRARPQKTTGDHVRRLADRAAPPQPLYGVFGVPEQTTHERRTAARAREECDPEIATRHHHLYRHPPPPVMPPTTTRDAPPPTP